MVSNCGYLECSAKENILSMAHDSVIAHDERWVKKKREIEREERKEKNKREK